MLKPWALAIALLGLLMMQGAQAQTKSRLNSILERGTMRVGTTGDFNPMSIKDPATNTYKGFDVEAMEQLAKDMGVKVEWVAAEWATLVSGITSDRYDIFSGASLSMARAKTVAFSDPYFEAGTVPLVLKSNAAKFKSWNDVNKKGVSVAVLLGTVFEEQAKQHFPQAVIKSVEKPGNGFQEVLANRAQVTVTSNVEASTLIMTHPALTQVGTNADMRNKRPFAYPVPQGDVAWLTFVNNWIALKKSEGYFDTLEAKWMPRK
ncbi:MAG: amino acid ABC transporter substrate-binding protein [Betaproteobacteria bacterium]|nr:amino acid ABC transporter substrate-binding protein [Betaproteobacteria bacterium]